MTCEVLDLTGWLIPYKNRQAKKCESKIALDGRAENKNGTPVKFRLKDQRGKILKAFKTLIDAAFDENFDERLGEKLSHLPTKDEFYTKMDEVMGELKTIREEQVLQSQHLSDHNDRLEKIEDHLGSTSN